MAWGIFHGVFLIFERAMGLRILERLPRIIQHAYVLATVIISWVFFRSESIGQAFSMIQVMFGGGQASGAVLPLPYLLNTEIILAFIACCVFSFPSIEWIKWPFQDPRDPLKRKVSSTQFFLAVIVLAFVFGLSLSYLASNTFNPFIYYRF